MREDSSFKRVRERVDEVTSLFIDNLPKDVRKIWVYNLFSRFGKILELFISNKTSKINGQRFGFVKFGTRKEAYQALEGVNDCSWVWNYKINIARYLKVTERNSYNNQQKVRYEDIQSSQNRNEGYEQQNERVVQNYNQQGRKDRQSDAS